MTILTPAEMRALIARAGSERWAVDPDDRPGMEYNNHIVVEGAGHLRIAFMAHDGPDLQDEFDAKAELIAAARNAMPAYLDTLEAQRVRIEELERLLGEIASCVNPDDPGSYRNDDPSGCIETIHDLAVAFLPAQPDKEG